MERETRLKRLHFRAWHRGTREADFMIGGFFDRHSADWNSAEMDWFERLLEQDDVDVMAWAIGTQPVPENLSGRVDGIDAKARFHRHSPMTGNLSEKRVLSRP